MPLPPPVVSNPCLLTQGRYLTTTLHAVLVSVLSLYGANLNSNDLKQQLIASCMGHLQAMWEANCSCRRAGYPQGSFAELVRIWSDGRSGLPSPIDVPTMSQAAARESAAEVLRSLRQLVGLVLPDPPEGGSSDSTCDPTSYAGWELLQAELLAAALPSEGPPSSESPPSSAPSERPPSSAPSERPPSFAPSEGAHSALSWGEALWCFNPACTNLEGPSELALKTHACGGGCGVRYCSPACQAQGWRDGHRLSCGELRAGRGKAAD